jgi:hypothetical protein
VACTNHTYYSIAGVGAKSGECRVAGQGYKVWFESLVALLAGSIKLASPNKHVHAVHCKRISPMHGQDSLALFLMPVALVSCGQDRVRSSRENGGKVKSPECVAGVAGGS